METVRTWIEWVGLAMDVAGVATIVVGVLVALARFAGERADDRGRYRRLRQDLGRGILLGLEVLIAADIIRTVAVTPTISDVLALGLIVLIRTFLSVALQVEVEGSWPWRQPPGDTPRPSR